MLLFREYIGVKNVVVGGLVILVIKRMGEEN